MASVNFGDVVKYNGRYLFVIALNGSDKVQLMGADGIKLSGTPSVDKVEVVKSCPVRIFNNNPVALTKDGRLVGKSGVIYKTGPLRSQVLALFE